MYEHYEHSPLSFFDDVSRRAFFQPLRVHPFLTPANKVNDRLRAQRQRFIEQCFETIDSSTYEISQLFLNQTSNSRTWRKANSSDFEDSLERSQCLERGFLIMCLVEEWELDIGGLQIRVNFSEYNKKLMIDKIENRLFIVCIVINVHHPNYLLFLKQSLIGNQETLYNWRR